MEKEKIKIQALEWINKYLSEDPDEGHSTEKLIELKDEAYDIISNICETLL